MSTEEVSSLSLVDQLQVDASLPAGVVCSTGDHIPENLTLVMHIMHIVHAGYGRCFDTQSTR